MSPRSSAHDRYRELLAARLDGPLTRAEHRLLNAHLRTCADCRRAEVDYRAQRAQLQSLRPPIPPRDLWARTSGAIDREVARRRYRPLRRRRPIGTNRRQTSPGAVMTALAAVGAVTAFVVLEFGPSLRSPSAGDQGMPTPFSVADQQLAFIGSNAADMAIYSTQVNRMCPQTAPDCFSDEGIIRTPVSLPSSVHPRTVALSPSGHQLALVGEDVGQDVIAVVTLAGDRSAGSPSARPTERPRDSGSTSTSSGPSVSAPPTGSAGTSQPSLDTPPATAPPASAIAGLTVLSILDDVHSAGSPPAWSTDGAMLAFSAMPADGSLGPDVYVWQPGESRARAVTTDHASFFASWSGPRIVASRIKQPNAGDSARSPRIVTVVIDPLTLASRDVDGPQMWLPQVNDQSTQAVVWYGALDWSGTLPTPDEGALYMVNWSRLDPWAGGSVTGPAAATEHPGASTIPDTSATPAPSSQPDATEAPDASAQPDSSTQPEPSGAVESTPTPGSTTPPEPRATPADGTPQPAPRATFPAIGDELSAIDPGRDPVDSPVTDWQVRWSSNGQVLGIWVADVRGSSWGKLVVLALDPSSGAPLLDTPLLQSTLARRGFTLGLSRVAWVAPTDESPDGELRIRTWGSDGVGGLRLPSLDLQGVVPAF
jgi:hypothetical protein